MCTSIHVRLRFFGSIFCSRRPFPHSLLFPSTSTLRTLLPQCRRNRLLLAENPQMALHKVCVSHFSINYSGSIACGETLVSSHLVVQISPPRITIFSNTVCVLDCIFFCNLFFIMSFFSYTDSLQRSLNVCTVLISVHILLSSPGRLNADL